MLLSVCAVTGMIGWFTCSTLLADEQEKTAIQVGQREKSLERQARRAQSRALTATSYAMLEKYTLGQSNPQDWQSLLATELAARWTIKGDSRRQDNSWILGGKAESVARFDVAARPLVILCADLQCKKSTAPFSQPRITVWVRDRASGRVQQSSFSLPEGSANTDRQQVCILARYDMETGRMCTAQWSGETDRSAGNFSQPPGDIVAIGFHVPEGSQLKVHRLQLRRLAVVGKEEVPVRSE